MARGTRASLSKTSGQGVSRRSYQTAYSLGHDSGARLPAVRGIDVDIASAGGRNYGKSSSGPVPGYGDTPGLPKGIEDVEELGRGKPARSNVGLQKTRVKKLK